LRRKGRKEVLIMTSEVSKALNDLLLGVRVTNQAVTYAKSYIISSFQRDTFSLLKEFLKSVDAVMPQQLIIHASADTPGNVKKAADSISWTLAFCEAIWGLISSNLIIPALEIRPSLQSLPWTTMVGDRGGESSSLDLSDISLSIPARISYPASRTHEKAQPLTDPDLYLNHASIGNISSEVEEALREAVLCFKHDLYLACLALLGKASEGAWIELGLALSKHLPQDRDKKITLFRDNLTGIGKKINEVLHLYERKDVFESIYKQSGYSPKELRNVFVWADAVRESRNSIHYGAKVSMPNSYEKVAALLIGAVQHLKVVYAIIGAANPQGDGSSIPATR
jgi:hypothetical protein